MCHSPRRHSHHHRRDQLLPLDLRRLQFGFQRLTQTQQLLDTGDDAPLFCKQNSRWPLSMFVRSHLLLRYFLLPLAISSELSAITFNGSINCAT